MPPKAKSAERVQHEAEAQRARAAALQYLAKTGSGPSQKEIAQQQRQREKWTNPTTQAVQQRLAHLQPPASGSGGAPTRDNTLAVVAAQRARLMLQGGSTTAVDTADLCAVFPPSEAWSIDAYSEAWRQSVGLSDDTDGLPDGWKPAVDPSSGETYYWNEKTKETSWDRPQAPKPSKSESSTARDDGEEALRDGWEEVEDPHSGQTYYWHRESNETTWTKPIKMTVSLEQAREAKSKLDAILKLCGPSKTPVAHQQKAQSDASTVKESLQDKQNDSPEASTTRKRGTADSDDISGPSKKARSAN